MRRLLLHFILLTGLAASAQDKPLLTAEEAIRIALENNYDIRIANNDLRIDQANATPGNAGMLPNVGASVVDSNGLQYIKQTRSDGTVNEANNGKNNALQYGVSLGWTVFDGLSMFARYDQLKAMEQLGKAEMRQAILTNISDVLTTYFNLVQQKQQITALDSAMTFSKERVTLAQNRFTIGKAAKLEVLNAQVDLNTDLSSMATLEQNYATTKITLNQLLARDPKIDFTVVDSVAVDRSLMLPELTELAQKQNPELETQVINKKISELSLKQIKGARYPAIAVNTGYNFSDSQSSLGFTTQSYSRGLTYGFSATLNLFDGFNQRRAEKVARIQIETAELAIQRQQLAVVTALDSAYQAYTTNLRLIRLEHDNEVIARQNFNITNEKFRIGTITTLELRTAQLNFVNARVRSANAQYLAKLSEISLKELAGSLNF